MLDTNKPEFLKASVVYNPFDISDRTDVELELLPGKSLTAYVSDLPEEVEWAVTLDGVIIPAEGIPFTFPKPNSRLIVVPVPQGGGGGGDGKAILAIVAMVALSIFAPIAGAALFGSGLAGSLATAAISIAGGVLINALIPPPENNLDTGSQSYGIDGPKNTNSEGIPYPILFGEHAFGGNICDIFTENATDEDGKDIQYLFMRSIVSEGPIKSIGQLYLNDQNIETFEDVEFDYRLGNDNQSTSDWFSETNTPINQGKVLTTSWQSYTTSTEVDKIRVNMVAAAGLGAEDNKGRKVTVSVPIEIEYSKTTLNEWKPVRTERTWNERTDPNTTSNAFKVQAFVTNTSLLDPGSSPGDFSVQLQYRIKDSLDAWTSLATRTGTVAQEGQASVEWRTNGLTDNAWEFQFVEASDVNVSAAVISTVWVKTEAPLVMADDSSEIVRRTFKTDLLDEAVYDVRFRRVYEETGNAGWAEEVTVSDIGEILVEPLSMPFVSWIGVKAKLTGQLNGIPTLTGSAEGRIMPIYDHNGAVTDIAYSQNPADIVLEIYLNDRYGGHLEPERIDFAAYSEWRDFCTANSLTFNGLFYEASNIDDALKHVYIAGRAQRISSGAKLSVAIDRPDTPTMMFDDGNIAKGTFEIVYLPFSDRINDLEVAFNDKNDKYKRRAVRVTNNEALNRGEPLKTSTIELKGVVDQERALREGILRMNYNQLVKRTATWESPIEAISCSVGDVVVVQHEMPGWGNGGRVLSGTTTSITLDKEITFVAGRNYRFLLHQSIRNSPINVTVTGQTGNLITLSKTISATTKADRFTSVAAGVDFAITRVIDSTTIILEDSAVGVDLTSVTDASIAETDYLDDVLVVNAADLVPENFVTTNVIEIDGALKSAPESYANYIFGEVDYTKKPFRIKSLKRSSEGRVSVTAIEYIEDVYADTPQAQTHNYTSLINSGHVINLTLEEKTVERDSGFASRAVATWGQPLSTIYTGAELQVSINGEVFETYKRTTGTKLSFPVESADVVIVRVVALDITGNDTISAAGAPTASLTVSGVTSAPATPTNWTGVSGFDTITLLGDANSETDFKHFKIYGATAGSPTLQFLAFSATNHYVRRPPADDTFTRYKVSAVNNTGDESATTDWITVSPMPTAVDVDLTAPTGLTLTSTVTDTGLGATLIADWNAVSGIGTYELKLTPSGGTDISYLTTALHHEWSVPPSKAFNVAIRSINAYGEKSAWSASEYHLVTADTVAPAVPTGVSASGGIGAIWLEWDANTEADLSHYEVSWKVAGGTQVTDPTPAPTKTSATAFTRAGLPEATTEYYYVRAVDTSNNKSAWTLAVSVTTTAVTVPAVGTPGGLALTTTLLAGDISVIDIDFNAVSGAVLYEIGITRDGGNENYLTVGTAGHQVEAIAGSSYSIRVLAMNSVGQKSNWSSPEVIVAAADSTPPAVPTGLGLTGGFNTIWVDFDEVADTDLAYYEVVHSATDTLQPTNPTDPVVRGLSTKVVISGLANDVTRWISVRAVDTSGNKSAWSLRLSATTPDGVPITTADLVNAVDSTSFATGLTGVEVVATLPVTGNFEGRTATLTTDGKLYRYHSGVWTAAVPADDLTGQIVDAKIAGLSASKLDGQITGTQITDDAVSADKIAANAITAGKLAIGDFENLNRDSDFLDPSAWAGGAPTYQSSGDPVGWGSEKLIRLTELGTEYEVVNSAYYFDVNPEGEKFWFSWLGRLISGTGIIYADVQYSTLDDFSGTVGVDHSFDNVGTVTTTSRTKMTGEIVVPAGYRFARIRLIKGNDGVTDCFFGGVQLRRKARGELIVDGSITSDKILTNSIQAGHIQTDAITTDKIDADAITSAKIEAGAVKAAQIDAGAITASKLSVGDFTNLNTDRDFADEVAWGDPGSGYFYDTAIADWGGSRVMRIVGLAGEYEFVYGPTFAVSEGEEFWGRMRGQVYTGTTGSVKMNLEFAEFADFVVSTHVWFSNDSITIDTSGITSAAGSLTAPADSKFCRIRVYKNNDGDATEVRVAGIEVRRKNGGELIVDGAIKADHVDTGTIEAVFATIGTAIITDAHVVELDAQKLIAGTTLTDSILVDGTAMSSIKADAELGAQEPATRVNNGSVEIEPGLITISGPTTLADWRGTDTTTIKGGAIETNSITARSIVVGDSDNLFTWGSFEADVLDMFTFSGTGLVEHIIGGGTTGGNRIRIAKDDADMGGSNVIALDPEHYIPVEAGVPFYCEGTFFGSNSTASAGAYLQLRWYDADKVYIDLEQVINNEAITTAPQTLGKTVTPPVGSAYCGLHLVNYSTQSTCKFLNWNNVTMRRMIGGSLVVNGAIDAVHIGTGTIEAVFATIGTAIVTDAHILGTLTANKITSLNDTVTLTTAGTTIGTMEDWADNPANRVNAKSTVIEPGKILISGDTNLDDWRGTDLTTINGGVIETDTISARHIRVTDFTNLLPGGNCEDQKNFPFDVYNPSTDVMRTGYIWGTTSHSGSRSIRVENGATTRLHNGGVTIVTPGDEIYMEFWMRRDASWDAASGDFKIRVKADITDAYITALAFDLAAFDAAFVPANTWAKVSKTFIVPTDVYGIWFQIWAAGTPAGYCWLDDFTFRRRVGGHLIVDGAITADKILAGEITGSHLATNTISANKLTIANRGITVQKIKFTTNDPSADSVSWTDGGVRYTQDNGTTQFISVLAGSQLHTGSRLYFYFTKGVAGLTPTIDPDDIALYPDRVLIATYHGGTDLTVNFGQTIIDGDHIQTGSITADKIDVGAITAEKITAGTITASHVQFPGGDNLNKDIDFEDADYWTPMTNTTLEDATAATWGSDRYMEMIGVSTSYVVNNQSQYFMADPAGEKFFLSYKAQKVAGSGTGCYVDIQCSASSSWTSSSYYSLSDKALGDAAENERSGLITIPAGKPYCRLRIIKADDGCTTARIGGVILRRSVDSKLILPNAVTKVRKSTAAIPQCAWPPEYESEYTVMLYGEVFITGTGSETTVTAYINVNGTDVGAPLTATRPDPENAAETSASQSGVRIWKDTVTAGQVGSTLTINVNLTGTNGTFSNGFIIVIETKR